MGGAGVVPSRSLSAMPKPKLSRREIKPLLILLDTLGGLAGFWMAFGVRLTHGEFLKTIPAEASYPLLSVVITVLVLVAMQLMGLYHADFLSSRRSTLWNVIWATGMAVTGFFALSFILRSQQGLYSRGVIFLCLVTIPCTITIGRVLLMWGQKKFDLFSPPRALIVGWSPLAVKMMENIEASYFCPVIVAGILCDDPERIPEHWKSYHVGPLSEASTIIESGSVEQLIVMASQVPPHPLSQLCQLADRHLVKVGLVPDVFEVLMARLDLDRTDGIPILILGELPLDRWYNRVVKRLVDVVGGALGLAMSVIPGLVVALLVRRDSPGPIFFCQERVGKRGTRFRMYKFRTMKHGAEKEDEQVGLGRVQDPRMTPLGATLRKYNLDELPQFWNILCGHMSLVGPRPERTYYVDKFRGEVPHYMPRHYFKPGLTGLAQIRGLRGDTSLEKRIEADLEYLENWSLGLDFRILMVTAMQMLMTPFQRKGKRNP